VARRTHGAANVVSEGVQAIVDAATAPDIGVRIVDVVALATDAVAEQATKALQTLGFLVVRRVCWPSADVRRELSGRHVALMSTGAGDCERTAACIRWLGRQSPRGHLVVRLQASAIDERGAAGEALVRERALGYEPESDATRASVTTAWLRRADACRARHRFAAAERWFRAVAVSAERRGDQATAGAAGERLVDLLIEHGHARVAWHTAGDLAERLTAWAPRASLVARATNALLVDGEIDRAEAVVAALEAEARVLGEELPQAVVGRRAELCFWRGRFDRTPIALARSPEAYVWCGLSAWARGDGVALEVALAEPLPAFWHAALEVLGRRRAESAEERARAVLAAAHDEPARVAALARAVAADALLSEGRTEDAVAVLNGAEPPPDSPEALLHAWLIARSAPDRDGARALTARIRRAGLDGILRWGEGKDGMHLVHGLPALLQLVQDADDDQAALAGGCAWLRKHSGAEAVAIFEAGESGILAADGWTAADRDDRRTARSPVRYGRAVIGQVAARGPERDRAGIEQAAQALAALVAPAVRSRLDALALSREAHRAAPEILGVSPAIVAVREAITRAALSGFPVLVEGESGTGKELVARALHRLSARRDRQFAAVNCAALTDDLLEAELFGHARGAFTGAMGTRTGLFEWASGGTLFLDEIGELSPRGQAKLLRALQEREIRRVGENASRAIDVRLVAATNVTLAEAVVRGAFRQDLLFRLAVVRIKLPALRDRVEDIRLLALAFWRQMAAERGVRARLGPDALAAFCRHSWPGNVRELQNTIAGLLVAVPSRGRVTERHVRQVLNASSSEDPTMSLTAAREVAERRAVAAALARHAGRRSTAARELGMSRQGLTKALRRLGLAELDDGQPRRRLRVG
jgi:DNA-binding NtrC family response regulator